MLGDTDRAADAMQMAFVRAWERSAQFRPGSDYAAWIVSIAVSVCLISLRTERRRRIDDSGGERTIDMIATLPPETDMRLALEEGIARLPPVARTVFVLHDVEGYRTDEVAHTLGIAPATVRVHLHTARKALRNYLAL